MRGKDAAERSYPEDTGAPEDAASRRPARLGGTRLRFETSFKEERVPADRPIDVDLTLLVLVVLVILLPAIVVAGAIVYALRPREDEIVVAATGFVVVRD